MDIANIYDSKRDVQEFDKLEVKLISVINTVEELIKQQKELNPLFAKGTPKEYASAMSQLDDVLKRLAKTERYLLDLTKNYDKITQNSNNTTKQSTKATGELGNQTALLREKKRLLNKEAKDQAQVEIQNQQLLRTSLGLYNKVQLKLNALTVKYNELAIKKQLGIKLSEAEEKSYNNLSAKIQKYDTALKAVDASVGKYSRNVGNYDSGFNPLSNSINQLAREAPAFANSMQTGFMAISNNIPIFTDAIGQAVKQNKILKSEGKATTSVLKQVGAAIFSWQTLLSVGVTLLTIYGADLVDYVAKLTGVKKALDATTASQQAFSEALKNGDYAKTVNSVKEMSEFVKLAKDGFIDKSRVLKEYNEGLGKVLGTASSFNEIETIMIAKTPGYLQAMRLRSAAQVALQNASEARAKADFANYQKEEDFYDFNSDVSNFIGKILPLTERRKQEMKKQSAEQRKVIVAESKKTADTWDKVYDDQMKQAAEASKKTGLNTTNLFLGNTDKEKKTKTKDGLTNEQKSYLDTLQAWRDNEMAINRESQLKGEKNEKEYQERNIDIVKEYRDKVMNYLHNTNARGQKISAATRRRSIEEVVRSNKEIFDYEKDHLESSYKMRQEVIERKMNEINNDEYSFEIDKIQQRNELYNLQIADANKYYDDLLKSAKKYSQEYIAIEAERDDKIGAIQDKQNNNNKNINNAIRDQLEYFQKIEDAYRTASDLEERRVILANSKLTIDQRDYLISVLEKDQAIERLSLQEKQLQSEKESLETKAKSSQLTLLESQRLAEINLQLSDISYELERQKKQKLVLEWGELRKNLSPTIDYIRNSFNNLGLDNLANSFDSVLDEIGERFKETGKIAFTFKDAVILASSAAADALTQISNAQKERTIANLDEQLKRSQESSEQEIGFINQRLEMLNAIQDKTVEQTQERNALEDEARVIKEQQLQREKLIAAQKARAEQRAAAQQALINGGLAATKTLATLGVPAGLLPAGIALAFGAVQAGLIMAKNPVPQYFVGTNHASEGWALTQERGAEIITDKSGNIKTWGNNRGAQMTYMEEGDRVLTAFESQDFKKKIRDVSMPDNIFLNNARESVLPAIVMQTPQIDSKEIARMVGSEFERVIKKYDKVNIYEENGVIYKQTGSNHPVVIGYSSKPKNDKPNNRDYRNFRD